jgi:hypothetical protein
MRGGKMVASATIYRKQPCASSELFRPLSSLRAYEGPNDIARITQSHFISKLATALGNFRSGHSSHASSSAVRSFRLSQPTRELPVFASGLAAG